MKLITSLLFFLFIAGPLNAAAGSPPDSTVNVVDRSASVLLVDKGKKLVTEGKNREALVVFREAAMKDPFSWKPQYWIGWCHARLNNYGYGKQYALTAIKLGGSEVDSDVYDILGTCLHRTGSLDSAEIYYAKGIELMSKNSIKELGTDKKLADCRFAKSKLETGAPMRTLVDGDVNSGFNDYSPLLTDKGKTMYFASRRSNTTGGKMNPDDQEYFEDIYRAVWNDATQSWDSITNKLDRINSAGFDAMSWVSEDGMKALVTMNNTATDAKKVTKSSDICEVSFSDKGKWNAPKVINNKSINTSFFEGSATMTADGNTMYFVSDRKAEKRSTDIYMVQKVGKKWGEAVPVSDSINTTGRETTPYITPDGRLLFFSSDGRTGMGGMDIFVCENRGSSWSAPVNLGPAVNSVNDDTHFVLYKSLGKAMMASFTVSGQKSSLDIYEIDLSKLQLPYRL